MTQDATYHAEQSSSTNTMNELSKTKVTPPSNVPSFSRPVPPHRPGASRKASQSGGIQMILDEAGSWSGLSNHDATLPVDSLEGVGAKDGKSGASGMLGFLNRKKGRDRSPKPQEPGILGKEGARRIIS